MSQDQQLHNIWLQNPTGLISKATLCERCATYNARTITSNLVLLKDEKLLLVHRGHEPQKGRWGFPGGYLGWDETVAEGAVRELKEETGLNTQDLQLVGIRSDLSSKDSRQNIDMYFFSNQVSGTPQIQVGEIAAIEWFSLDQLPKPLAFGHDQLFEQFLPVIRSGVFVPVML